MPDWIADLGSDILRDWSMDDDEKSTPLVRALFDRTGINDLYNHISPDPDIHYKENGTMTDIVERLRALSRHEHDDLSIGEEAADVIEHLRIVKTEEAELVGEIERLRAENERLRRNLEIWRRNGGDILREAEIEKLRNESHADEQRYQAAKVEIERLQDELRIVKSAPGSQIF